MEIDEIGKRTNKKKLKADFVEVINKNEKLLPTLSSGEKKKREQGLLIFRLKICYTLYTSFRITIEI